MAPMPEAMIAHETTVTLGRPPARGRTMSRDLR
jgi:hypothetical protein